MRGIRNTFPGPQLRPPHEHCCRGVRFLIWIFGTRFCPLRCRGPRRTWYGREATRHLGWDLRSAGIRSKRVSPLLRILTCHRSSGSVVWTQDDHHLVPCQALNESAVCCREGCVGHRFWHRCRCSFDGAPRPSHRTVPRGHWCRRWCRVPLSCSHDTQGAPRTPPYNRRCKTRFLWWRGCQPPPPPPPPQ